MGDERVAALIGAAVAGAASGFGALIGRRRQRRRIVGPGSLAERVTKLEAERAEHKKETARMMEHIEKRLDRLSESVDKLEINAASTSALLPELRDQLKELRQDLRRRPSVRELDH